MNRYNNVPFSSPVNSSGPATTHKHGPGRIPAEFMEAMKRVMSEDNHNTRRPEQAGNRQPAHSHTAQTNAAKPSTNRWRSSFKPLGERGEEEEEEEEEEEHEAKRSRDQNMTCPEKATLYDPYDPGSSDSEVDGGTFHHPSSQNQKQENDMECQGSEDGTYKSRWDSQFPKSVKRPFDRDDCSAESTPIDNKGHISGHRLLEQDAYDPHTEPLDRPGYGSISRTRVHRVHSTDRAREFHNRGQEEDEDERIRVPQRMREMSNTVRLSPPPNLRHDFKRHLDHRERGPDHIMSVTETAANRRKLVIMDKTPVTCDLCDVELTNGQELEDHLNGRVHWGTLEHIQDNNHYDDLTIAFLQEVMLYKSRQVSRAIEDSALLALQENDHMTKVEMFHCAACDVFVSTSASSVQSHITSAKHLSNTQEFEVQQRHSCLGKAVTIMKELEPQFELFAKGENPI